MNRVQFFLSLAFKNLWRSGQRAFVALLCIAFGVMSLVSMTLLSQSIGQVLTLAPREKLGADISLGGNAGEVISPEMVAQLDHLKQIDQIQGYTTLAYTTSLMFHLPDSGEAHFAVTGLGMDPGTYPLAGSFTIGQPAGTRANTLLLQAGDLIITRDIAQDNHLAVGDRIILSDLDFGAPVEGRIRGIAYDTPNHQGSKIYYSKETAAQLTGGRLVLNTALVITGDISGMSQAFSQSGWEVKDTATPTPSQAQTDDLMTLGLKGLGFIGLLVGGVGISNTMQVLLRRRQQEVAIWKTLGYREIDLQAMFTLEAALLGLLGSLLGALIGVAISSSLVEVFRRTSNLLFGLSVTPLPVMTAVLVGTFMTVIFASWAIVSTSQARPMALLRNEPVEIKSLPRLKTIGLALGLGLTLLAVTSLVMGSLINGSGVLLAALVSLGVLGGIFSLLAGLAGRLFPSKVFPLARMIKTRLKRRGISFVFAMIALFAGVIPIAFATVVIQTSIREMDERSIQTQGYNINIIAPAAYESTIRQALDAQTNAQVSYQYEAAARQILSVGDANPVTLDAWLIGQTDLQDYKITGAGWGTVPEGVYVAGFFDLPIGSQVEVTLADGSTRRLEVAGSFDIGYQQGHLFPRYGLLMPADLFKQITAPEKITSFVNAPEGQVSRMTASLGKALPGATAIDLLAYAARFIQAYRNLFVLAVAMASLAFLAGVVLVANSVSLAMLDRRHEIGVLKTVGYSQAHILLILEVEYGVGAVIACVTGLVTVQVFLWVLSMANHVAGSLLVLTPLSGLLIALFGIGLVILTVLGVTYRPMRVSPSVILNERN
jgi:putative ABC transport system permease protein